MINEWWLIGYLMRLNPNTKMSGERKGSAFWGTRIVDTHMLIRISFSFGRSMIRGGLLANLGKSLANFAVWRAEAQRWPGAWLKYPLNTLST